ncbi:MAG TPA: DoxX family protein [Kineosporiaceae bacterium]|nr:DoxX family protein [Kineosporiaceae bacterium]
MQFGRFAARALIGSLFIGHGTQKLFGWFDGPGLDGTQGMMESLNLRPGRQHALAAGLTETTGGALLVAGLATPLAASGLIGTMISAIRTVHLKNGPWGQNGGWEYNAVLIAALLALAEEGPGDLSLDNKLGFTEPGPLWALGALAVGAAASAAVVEVGRRQSIQSQRQGPSEAQDQPETLDQPETQSRSDTQSQSESRGQ